MPLGAPDALTEEDRDEDGLTPGIRLGGWEEPSGTEWDEMECDGMEIEEDDRTGNEVSVLAFGATSTTPSGPGAVSSSNRGWRMDSYNVSKDLTKLEYTKFCENEAIVSIAALKKATHLMYLLIKTKNQMNHCECDVPISIGIGYAN